MMSVKTLAVLFTLTVLSPQVSDAGLCSFLVSKPPVSRTEFEETRTKVIELYDQKSLRDIKLDLKESPETQLALLDVLIEKNKIPNVSISEFFKSLDSTGDSRVSRKKLNELTNFIESDIATECLRLFRGDPVSERQVEELFTRLFWITHADEGVIHSIYKRGWQGERFSAEQKRFERDASIIGGLAAYQNMGILKQNATRDQIAILYQKTYNIRKIASAAATNWFLSFLPVKYPPALPLRLKLEYWRKLHPDQIAELEQLLVEERYETFKNKLREDLGIWGLRTGNWNMGGRIVAQFVRYAAILSYTFFLGIQGPELVTKAYFSLSTTPTDIQEQSVKDFDPKLSRLKQLDSWLKNYEKNAVRETLPQSVHDWKNAYIEGETRPYPPGYEKVCQAIEKQWKYLLGRPDSDFVIQK